jgi:hypothetical protein
MFLVTEQRHGVTHLVFTVEDPRHRGFRGSLIEGVSLDYEPLKVYHWPDGDPSPEACVGRAKDDPKRYKVFRYGSECDAAGYERVPGIPLVFGSWSDYLAVRLTPPDPEQIRDEQWFDYLDKLDEDSRQRRRTHPGPTRPTNGNRDEIAAWLAKTHILSDSAIREVWYLPTGAAPDEIRLLEVNDRFAGSEEQIDAVDFGVDVGGKPFRLFVADITSDQLVRVKEDPSQLPPGWSIDGARHWGRQAA